MGVFDMKKTYTTLSVEILAVDFEDVLTSSAPAGTDSIKLPEIDL